MVFHAEDAAAAAAEVAHDIAHVIFRDDDVDVVNRFQEDRLGFRYGFLEGLSGSDFEGHFRRIDRMIGTIGQGNFDVDHGEAGDEAFFQGFTDAFFNGRDVLFRYGAAKDLIDEFKGFACRQRLDVQEDVAELTVAAALFLVFAFGCRLALDGFTIRDVNVFLFGFDTVFPFDFGQDVVEVDIAHAADDELLAFGALFDLARRVFFADPQEGVHQFFFFALLFRDQGYRMQRVREADGVIDDGEIRSGKGIASPGIRQFRQDDDVAGNSRRDGDLFLADQGQDFAHLFFFILGHIV